jgi:hypothetical protein
MTTARDQILGALYLIGAAAEGETPSGQTMNDALEAFNQMIDAWSIEDLMIFSTEDQNFTWPSGQASRTLGPTGNFVGNRPSNNLQWSSYFINNSISYPLTRISEADYNQIAVKTTQSSIPEFLFVNPTFPNTTLTLYPVPDTNLDFHLITNTVLTQPANLSTTLSFPPGYLRAFKFNLAVEISAYFGKSPAAWVAEIAKESKAKIKRKNVKLETMSMPCGLPIKNGGYDYESDS